MILERITIDWRCAGCGAVRRVDVDDVSRAVAGYKPPGWYWDNSGQLRCDLCGTKVTTTTPDGVTTIHQGQRGETPAEMRARMSGMRIGGGVGSGQPDYGIRQPPQPMTGTGGGPPADNILRDGEGNPIGIIGPGGAGQGYTTQYVEAGTGAPMPTHGASGGGADAKPGATIHVGGTPEWKGAPPVDLSQGGADNSKLFRPGGGGNIVFEDTRTSEYLGPQKVEAGVPSLGSKICIGCHHEINDGTVSGPAEAWRWASNPESTTERGHPHCLQKIGR